MAGLFSKAQRAKIDATAVKSEQPLKKTSVNHKSINNDLNRISQEVLEYFKDSPAILIHNMQELHDYISNMIDAKYGALDCETTGLDRINDNVVGFSLYYPGGVECYIPIKHIRPIVDELRPNQLTYEECRLELQRLIDNKVRLVFANADFDLAMIYKNFKVDLCPICYYDVILAWRCLKENEKSNKLKDLYHKYVLKGEGESKQFSDFFPVNLFPYCNPDIAKLYAANDAKITYELFLWQLPYVMKDNPKCKSKGLENIADLVWNIEMPLIKTCQMMHRNGVYLDKSISDRLNEKYDNTFNSEVEKLRGMVQDILDNPKYHSRAKRPFNSSIDFNYNSTKHVTYLLYSLMNLPTGKGGQSTDKEILRDFNLPITNQLLKVRSLSTLISTFVKKLPNATSSDSRIHCQFKQIGADTGRLSSADPNMQNIPSKSKDIRRMFRATPGYVMLSSDYSAQEPRITAYVSQDEKMIQSFKDGKDIYGSIASIAFEVPYEDCLEFHPVTGEYQPEGKARRGEAKTIVLGICYGRSVVTIADQLYGTNTEMTDDEKVKKAQYVYDSVLKAFPGLRTLMNGAENCARQKGYVETILGRRRHIPDMQLPEFEFVAMPGYVNPDIDPLNIDTLDNNEEIPKRIIDQLTEEFKSYKYYGQIVKKTKELKEDHIKVINNKYKIQEASRKCVNSIIQGSAAEQTKMAMLLIDNDPEWKRIGGRLLIPVHDELIAEVPMENWEEGAKILSSLMCKAADFLPFESKCDVEVTYRWYGLSYPCQYPQPHTMDNLSKDEIKWVQYHLFECGYELPKIKEHEDDELRGDAALGISGIVSDEYNNAISDYMNRYNIPNENIFIQHIHTKVNDGVILSPEDYNLSSN